MKTKLFPIFLLLIAAMVSPAVSFAQDIIIKKNGDEIKTKVLEVSSSEIKYKKFDNIDGPTYSIPKPEVFMIKYENGTKEIISALDAPKTKEQKKETVNKNKMFQKHKSHVALGYGFANFNGTPLSEAYSENTNDNGSLTGPLYVKYEYGAGDVFGIGINMAYIEYKYNFIGPPYIPNYGYILTNGSYQQTDTYTSFSVLLRANWHFGDSEKIDPYYGFGFGYRRSTQKTTRNPYGTDEIYHPGFGIGFETTFGIRVRFSDHVGAYAEAGIAKSALQIGLSAKF